MKYLYEIPSCITISVSASVYLSFFFSFFYSLYSLSLSLRTKGERNVFCFNILLEPLLSKEFSFLFFIFFSLLLRILLLV